jgi:hypothetical protein
MKLIKHLKARWLAAAMFVGVLIGELIAWQLSRSFDLRFEPILAAAAAMLAVALFVSFNYDGTD